MSFKPMLAVAVDLGRLVYPLIASPKLDGVRAVVRNGVVLSRTLKPIPNRFVQSLFKDREGYDGELIVGDPTSKSVYRETVSGVMTEAGEPNVYFHIFDRTDDPASTYALRLKRMEQRIAVERALLHSYRHIQNYKDLIHYETECLELGFEGLILRDPNGPYKFGRSTVREGWMLKLKRFVDNEYRVVGFEELLHNANEATTNELGRTKRSSHKANKVPLGTLGALILEHPIAGRFNVGTGFDTAQRQEIWDNREKYFHRFAKIKYFAIGMKDAPRHPVFLGWRDERDMS